MHADAVRAVGVLLSRGEILHIIPQNLIEYWAVATRPVEANGLGLSVAEAASELSKLKAVFSVLPDAPAIFADNRTLLMLRRHQARGIRRALVGADV